LKPRFPLNLYFKSWRDYEHVHIFVWCCKDLSWNQSHKVFWWIFLIPTGLISIDFIVTSAFAGETIDCVHYVAILLWVAGNSAWAYGGVFEAYVGDDIYPEVCAFCVFL
jgi:hypothetical protein